MGANAAGDHGEPAPRSSVATLAALYGAGGSVVGPRVAERLGVELLDRKVPEDVARQTGLSENDVGDVDERPRSRLERLTEALARASNLTGDAAGSDHRPDLQERQLRGDIEDALARLSAAGGVVVGRGGMVALADVPGVLHVRLGGPHDARLRQGMAIEGIDRETAEQRQEAEDRARIGYVGDAYGLDTCVDLVVAASRARTRKAGTGRTDLEPGPRS